MMIRRAQRVLRGNDRGAALPMVLVIFLVGFALVTAFLFAIISSAQVSQATRANIQAKAAAEAGIAAAQVKLPALSESGVNICTPFPTDKLVSDTAPAFKVTGKCDVSADAATLTIVSEGTAPNGSTAQVEAVFALQMPALSDDSGSEGQSGYTGDAIISVGGGAGTSQNESFDSLMLTTFDGKPTRIVTRKDSFVCNGVDIPGDFLAAGDVSTSPCVVNGDLHIGGMLKTNNSDRNVVSGDLRLAGNKVGTHKLSGVMGDASSIGKYNVYANGSVELHDGATVFGDLVVSGDKESYVRGTVKRNFTTNGTAEVAWHKVVEGNFTALGTGVSTINGTVKGDVFTNGNVHVVGTVGGDIVARGTGVLRVTGDVAGDIRTDGTVEVTGTVGGNIVALGSGTNVLKAAPGGNIQVAGAVLADARNLTFPGYIQAGETVSLTDAKVQGINPATGCNVTQGTGNDSPWSNSEAGQGHSVCNDALFPTFASIPAVDQVPQVDPPTIEPWRDYEFEQSDWPGFDVQTIARGECNAWKNSLGTGEGMLSELNVNTVFDLRECGDVHLNAWDQKSHTPKLGVDVAFIVDKVSVNGMTWSSKPGTNPKVWFVNPGPADSDGKNGKQHVTAMDFDNTTFDDSMRVMVYTPRTLDMSHTNFVGNVYAGSVFTGATSEISFAPMGLPSWGPISSNPGGTKPGTGGSGGAGSDDPTLNLPHIAGGISAAPLSIRDVEVAAR